MIKMNKYGQLALAHLIARGSVTIEDLPCGVRNYEVGIQQTKDLAQEVEDNTLGVVCQVVPYRPVADDRPHHRHRGYYLLFQIDGEWVHNQPGKRESILSYVRVDRMPYFEDEYRVLTGHLIEEVLNGA